jgi:putative flippase GtrA
VIGIKWNVFKEIIAFNIVGAVNTVITYGIFSLLVFAGINYRISLVLEYCFGITFSFFLNKRFTFHHTGGITSRMIFSMAGSYLLVLGINFSLLVFLVEKLHFNSYIGQLIALSVSVGLSFFAQKFIVFRKNQMEDTDMLDPVNNFLLRIKTDNLILKKLSVFSLIIIPVLLMFQGIDFTDTGWVLSNYQQMFSDPESVSYWFHLWLPNIIGGIWYKLFGWGGLLSFKIAAVLIFWLTAFLVYCIYKNAFGILRRGAGNGTPGPSISDRCLFLALTLGMALHFPSKITVIHYNNISMLFLTLCAFFLLAGINNRRTLFLYLSGAACCLSVFARLPNILGIFFLAAILYAWLLESRQEKVPEKGSFSAVNTGPVKQTAFFILGGISALIIVLALMAVLGHLDLYKAAVFDLFFGTKEDLSHYGSETIEKKFFLDWARALFAGSLMTTLSYFAHFLIKKINLKYVKIFIYAAAALITFFLTWLRFWPESMILVYPVTGFITITCLQIMLFLSNKYKAQKLLALTTVILMAILSVGSDTGMKVSSYAVIFGLPLVCWYWHELPENLIVLSTFYENKAVKESKLYFDQGTKRNVISLIIVIYTAYAVPFTIRNVYRDNSLRWKMNAFVDHPMLRGMLTTPKRAAAVESLSAELGKRIHPGAVLLTCESIPMVHFLMGTRPYLYNPWPILYLPVEFKKYLDKARRERPELPPAVLAKVEMRSSSWPASGSVNSSETAKANRAILRDFLDEEKYKIIWEIEAFEILVPPEGRQPGGL